MSSSESSDCGCHVDAADSEGQRRVLRIALALNAIMFAVGMAAGLVGRSSGLVADSLDMLADASAYAIALLAVSRSVRFKAGAARASGVLLTVLGFGVLADVARRGWLGSDPEGGIMVAVALVSLAVNATVLRMLGRVRGQGVHLNATWIFTRVDVIANLGVIVSGLIVLLTPFRYADLIVGAAIGLYVVKEGIEILRSASEVKNDTERASSPLPGA